MALVGDSRGGLFLYTELRPTPPASPIFGGHYDPTLMESRVVAVFAESGFEWRIPWPGVYDGENGL